MEINSNLPGRARVRHGAYQLWIILGLHLGLAWWFLASDLVKGVPPGDLGARALFTTLISIAVAVSIKAVLNRGVLFLLFFLASMQEFIRAGTSTAQIHQALRASSPSAEIKGMSYFWLLAAFVLLASAVYLLYSPETGRYYAVMRRKRRGNVDE